jgi:hypothetical protein
MKSHMLLSLLKIHLLINPKDTQLLKFLSCFQNLFLKKFHNMAYNHPIKIICSNSDLIFY